MASAIDLRVWSRLSYWDPRPILIGLAEIGSSEWLDALPYKVKSLRTQELHVFHERRLGALFFYLIGLAQRELVSFAHLEDADYDFVGHFARDGVPHFVPVQMKELPPDFLNPTATLQGIVDASRKKYTDASDVTIAISVNRVGDVRPGDLDLSGLNLGGLWLFGAAQADQSRWLLIGDLLKPTWRAQEFDYPSPS